MKKFIKKNWFKILISIVIVILFVFTLYFVGAKRKNKCLTIFAMDEILGFDYNNKNHLWIDDDFFGNSCNYNTFDCSDFCTQADAQKVFDECYNAPKDDNPVPDIHNLDKDNDKIPCESLQ